MIARPQRGHGPRQELPGGGPTVRGAQHHGDDALVLGLGVREQHLAGIGGIPGFEAEQSRKHAEVAVGGVDVDRAAGDAECDVLGSRHSHHDRMIERGPPHGDQIAGRGEMFGGVETVGVEKLGVGHPQRGRPLVHHHDEVGAVSCHCLGDRGGGVVARLDHDVGQQVIGHPDLALPYVGLARVSDRRGVGRGGNGDLVGEDEILGGQHRGHQLGDRGGGHLEVGILGPDLGFLIDRIHHPRSGGDVGGFGGGKRQDRRWGQRDRPESELRRAGAESQGQEQG